MIMLQLVTLMDVEDFQASLVVPMLLSMWVIPLGEVTPSTSVSCM